MSESGRGHEFLSHVLRNFIEELQPYMSIQYFAQFLSHVLRNFIEDGRSGIQGFTLCYS